VSDIVKARALAAVEFLYSRVPVQVGFVFGHGGVLAVGVGMIANVVLGERGDHVLALAPLERARLFADHLKVAGIPCWVRKTAMRLAASSLCGRM
jgi:hypothetical protein